MKKIVIVLTLLLTINVCAAQVVELRENIATMLIFPTEIIHHRGGYNPDDFVTPQQYKNILYVQPVGPFDESNLSVITSNGDHFSIILSYNQHSKKEVYVFSSNEGVYHLPENIKSESQVSKSAVLKSEGNPFVERIIVQKGYIASRNAVKYKSLIFAITGIYTADDMIFIRLNLENSSEIPYRFETINFTVAPKISKDLTSSAMDNLNVKWNWYQKEEIEGKGSSEMVFAFDKFTVGKDNELIINLIEQGGVRNLTIKIEDAIFLTAKQI